MDASFFIALIATVLTVIFTAATIPISTKLGLVDDPQKRPHPAHTQNRIVPRAGGLGIYLALVSCMLIFLPLDAPLVGIIYGITVLLLMGLVDDKLKTFNPYIRLLLLFLAASFPVLSGIGISFVTNPFSLFTNLNPAWNHTYIRLDQIKIPIEFFGSHQFILIADIMAFFWIVILTQIINWSKGVDGQMPGITLIAALTLGFLSLKFYSQGDLAQLSVAKLAFITAGTSLGFLFFNWYPAKIFPGFSGSTILAFMLAVLSILSGAKFATALLVLALPSADFIYTFLRRILNGKSPVWGDRGHLHHQLLDLGWSHQAISLFYIFISAILGIIAILINVQSKAFIVISILIVILGLILWINSFINTRKSTIKNQ